MDKLSLKVGQLHCESAPTGQMRCRTPRLPTPDTSTASSLDGSEGATFESSKYEFYARDASMQPQSRAESTHSDAYYHKPASESREHPEPWSRTPPYHISDHQRPSLPPLKYVLGDKLASPPCTPTMPSAASQPTPREPICNPDPYRPASLYPNKKQKTGDRSSLPSLSASSRLGTQSLGGFALSPIRSHPPYAQEHASSRPRSPSTQSPLTTGGTYSSAPIFQSRLPAPPLAPTSSGSSTLGSSQPYGIRQQPSHPARDERLWTGALPPFASGARTFETDHSRYPPPRTESKQDHFSAEQRTQGHAHSPAQQYPSPTMDTFRNGYSDGGSSRSRNEYGAAAYQSEHASDSFVPASYEYSYPKTRKRSNLPKQSTEIMRGWFDQNIENPYPSEEQKALFANATGISMTQVSNWFINHRRRCPELRDRRAERRKL